MKLMTDFFLWKLKTYKLELRTYFEQNQCIGQAVFEKKN